MPGAPTKTRWWYGACLEASPVLPHQTALVQAGTRPTGTGGSHRVEGRGGAGWLIDRCSMAAAGIPNGSMCVRGCASVRSGRADLSNPCRVHVLSPKLSFSRYCHHPVIPVRQGPRHSPVANSQSTILLLGGWPSFKARGLDA